MRVSFLFASRMVTDHISLLLLLLLVFVLFCFFWFVCLFVLLVFYFILFYLFLTPWDTQGKKKERKKQTK